MRKINHTSVNKLIVDPYEYLAKKANRLAWGDIIKTEQLLEKAAVIRWFKLLRDYSDETVEKIIVKGIFSNGFHKLSFILELVHNPDFESVGSKDAYRTLYNIVNTIPDVMFQWLDESEVFMSANVLQLLSK